MRGLFVLIDIAHAIPLEADEFYLYQLIGLRVETSAGETLGTLVEVLETGANDVYIVDSPRYGEILIPVTGETIVKTDVQAGVMVVSLPEGLLPTSGDETPDDTRKRGQTHGSASTLRRGAILTAFPADYMLV
ncbi:MAG: ribosome maturation factor RimM [Anaerolineae bacterium]